MTNNREHQEIQQADVTSPNHIVVRFGYLGGSLTTEIVFSRQTAADAIRQFQDAIDKAQKLEIAEQRAEIARLIVASAIRSQEMRP
jgi:hypothetical protein